jgi:hypothetical protein
VKNATNEPHRSNLTRFARVNCALEKTNQSLSNEICQLKVALALRCFYFAHARRCFFAALKATPSHSSVIARRGLTRACEGRNRLGQEENRTVAEAGVMFRHAVSRATARLNVKRKCSCA